MPTFIDPISYALKNKRVYNFKNLKRGSHKIVLYKSDITSYRAAIYDFSIYKNKEFLIHSKEQYTNKKFRGNKYTKLNIGNFLKKCENIPICVNNECILPPDVKPFVNAPHDMIYKYSVPITPEDFFLSKNVETDELVSILKFYGYKDYVPKYEDINLNKDVDKLVNYINGKN